jgi:hypothetical protein
MSTILAIGTPIVYRFQNFPKEYGIILKQINSELNIYLVKFQNREQNICTDYLELPDEEELEEFKGIESVNTVFYDYFNKYPTVKTSVHKGTLKVLKGTVCSISHIDLEDGEEVIILNKDVTCIYTRNWIEPYWKFISTADHPPRNPITNARIVNQADVERYTISIIS